MFRLRIGYAISGLVTGLILIFNLLWTLPDGKLHIFFCDVGQGDAAYIRFPDGRDMLIDGGPASTRADSSTRGGPNNSVLQCLSRHMPFWDRTIDIVVLSHPEKDHMGGLVSVVERYQVKYFIHSDVEKGTDVDKHLFAVVKAKYIQEKLVTAGERIAVGPVNLSVVWPSSSQMAMVLGVTTASVNDVGVVFWLRYGNFDALFPGDATLDERFSNQAVDQVEVLKVPHHGSRTGMTSAFLDFLKPQLAVISVGKNSFGHPTQEALQLLANVHARVLRTDQIGDIEVVSDGEGFAVSNNNQSTVAPAGAGIEK